MGYDFEHASTSDAFLAMRCAECDLVYLERRPAADELSVVYPDAYQAFRADPESGTAGRARRALASRRISGWCGDLPTDARVLDVGCGAGFHLSLLRELGPAWRVEGVDADLRAVKAARARGFTVHHGDLRSLDLDAAGYDLVTLMSTLERLPDPAATLARVRTLLKPGGRLGVVTHNTETLDFRLFRNGYWGGYDTPRHLQLFNASNLRRLGETSGLVLESIRTSTSPVSWVRSLRNVLVAHDTPGWVVRRFATDAPGSFAAFTAFDHLFRRFGRGALLNATFVRPAGVEPASGTSGDGARRARAEEAVLVVGGGFAGLVAAHELRRLDRPVVVFEASPHLGGLARSFRDEEGFAYDFGAHFITNRLAAVLGVSSACRVVERYDESVLLGERVFGYPFGLMRSGKMAGSALGARVTALTNGTPKGNARDWFVHEYGRELAHRVAMPLLEAWSGAPASELAPAVGDKLPGTARTIWLKVAARMSHRAVGCGYSGSQVENWNVWHVYPEEGVGRVIGRLAEELGDCIRTETPVSRIHVEEGRVTGVTAGETFYPASRVISTAPVHILSRLVDGDHLDYLSRFRYRPMVFVNLLLRRRGVIPTTMMWTPESEFPFFRLTEATRSMPWLAPPDSTILTADIGCQVGDEIWTMDDETLAELCLDAIEGPIPDIRQSYLRCRVLRTPFAYPVYLNEYEADRQRLRQSTGVEGLHSIGRHGRFSHDLMEDVYWTARGVVQEIAES